MTTQNLFLEKPKKTPHLDLVAPLEFPPTIHKNLFSTTNKKDSLQKTEATFDILDHYAPSRPKLLPPELPLNETEGVTKSALALDSFKRNLIRLVDQIEEIKLEEIQHLEGLITKVSDRMIETKKNETEKLKETENKSEEIESWTFLKNLATALLSAASIIIGGTLIATGVGAATLAGGLMISSGVFSLIGLGLANAKVNPYISGTFALCSAALGLAAGSVSFFAYAHQLPKLIVNIAQALSNIAYGATTIGRESTEYQKTLLDGELAKLQKELSLEKIEFDQLSDNLTKTAEILNSKEASKILKSYESSIKQILAGSDFAA